MKVLELFSGTGSIGKALQLGDFSLSIDSNPNNNPIINPTIRCDILQWDYKQYQPGYFDYIHASPPCQSYSIANAKKSRRDIGLPLADSLVQRTLEIIAYLKPKAYTIENPQTGYLKTRPFMFGIPFVDVDYCRYGSIVRKRTRLWTNVDLQLAPLCRKDCSMVDEKGNHAKCDSWGHGTAKQKASQRAIIPPTLCISLVEQIRSFVSK